MRRSWRSLTAGLALLTLVVSWPPASAGSTLPGARLEGLLLGVDGRPADGYAVHLIDDEGAAVGRAVTDADGVYTFDGLEDGRYSMGIEGLEGRMAPVAAPPVRLRLGQLVRRDVKMVEAGPEGAESAAGGNYGLGMWWAGLSTPAKAWTVVGLVAIAAITLAALTDDDDRPASPH
jgi:hypothetical protein